MYIIILFRNLYYTQLVLLFSLNIIFTVYILRNKSVVTSIDFHLYTHFLFCLVLDLGYYLTSFN